MDQFDSPTYPFFPATKREFVVMDTETTGLFAGYDELLELAIVDSSGTTLLHTYLTPERTTSWPEAEAIHGISPSFIFSGNFPTLESLGPQLVAILQDKDVVFYNASFDTGFLGDILTEANAHIYDAMEPFAELWGDWSDYHQSNTWQKLTTAARYVLHEWGQLPHSALGDALATRSVWLFLTDEQIRKEVNAKKRQIRIEQFIEQSINELISWDQKERQTEWLRANLQSERKVLSYLNRTAWCEDRYTGQAEASANVFCTQLTGYSVYDWLRYGPKLLKLRRYTSDNKPVHLVRYKEVCFLRKQADMPQPVAMLNLRKKVLDLDELYDLRQLEEGIDYVKWSTGEWPANHYSRTTLQRTFKLKTKQINELRPNLMRVGYKFNYLLYEYSSG